MNIKVSQLNKYILNYSLINSSHCYFIPNNLKEVATLIQTTMTKVDILTRKPGLISYSPKSNQAGSNLLYKSDLSIQTWMFTGKQTPKLCTQKINVNAKLGFSAPDSIYLQKASFLREKDNL